GAIGWTLLRIGAHVLKIARAKLRGGNNVAVRKKPLCVPSALIIEKKERRISLQRAANGSPVDIADQFQRSIRVILGNLGLLVEKIVGMEQICAVVDIHGAVKTVRAALGNQCDLRAGRASFVRGCVARSDAKVSDRILSYPQNTGEGI